MIRIRHILPTGKVVTDSYGKAMKQECIKDKVFLLDRNNNTVAVFGNQNVLNITNVAKIHICYK